MRDMRAIPGRRDSETSIVRRDDGIARLGEGEQCRVFIPQPAVSRGGVGREKARGAVRPEDDRDFALGMRTR